MIKIYKIKQLIKQRRNYNKLLLMIIQLKLNKLKRIIYKAKNIIILNKISKFLKIQGLDKY